MDHQGAGVPVKERILFAYLERVRTGASRVTAEDAERLRAAGWSDEAIYDAVTVCALFNFYTRWVDATGVSDMPAEAYALAGRRMAEGGYIPAEAEGGSSAADSRPSCDQGDDDPSRKRAGPRG